MRNRCIVVLTKEGADFLPKRWKRIQELEISSGVMFKLSQKRHLPRHRKRALQGMGYLVLKSTNQYKIDRSHSDLVIVLWSVRGETGHQRKMSEGCPDSRQKGRHFPTLQAEMAPGLIQLTIDILAWFKG